MIGENDHLKISRWQKHRFVIINSTLAGLFLLAITFSIFFSAKATTPNPGHPWTDIGNGLWQASNAQTALRTFIFPDTNAVILTSSSSLILPERTIVANTTLSTSTDGIVYVNAVSGPITVTLPSATGTQSGYVYEIKKTDTSPVGIVTINTSNSQTIDTLTNVSLAQPGEAILLQSDGSNWKILMRRDYDANAFHTRGTSSTVLTEWYSSYQTGTPLTTGSLTASKIYAMPLVITHVTTIDQIGIFVSSGVGASTAEIGIYNDNGNLAPGSLLVDDGSIATATNSVVVTSTTGLPITLDAGLYWMVLNPSGAITIRTFNVANITSGVGYATPASTAVTAGWLSTETKGPLPTPFPSAGSSTMIAVPLPAIFVHFSN